VLSPFWSRYSWHVPERLDVAAMSAAASLVVGRHDFTAFTPTETEHVFFDRLVKRCVWRRTAAVLYLEIEAETFLRHMVRILVGTMVEVGRGKRSPDHLATLLRGAVREGAGPTAPPQGLFLWDVSYGRARVHPAAGQTGARQSDHEGCVNILTPSRMMIERSHGMAANSCLIEVEKWSPAGGLREQQRT